MPEFVPLIDMFGRLFGSKSIISKIGVDPVEATPDRSGIAIAVVVKNEARFIPEWIRFHEFAGVDSFIIYDNGSTDGSADVALSSAIKSDITVIPWDQKLFDARSGVEIHNQVLAFSHAIRNFGPHFRWMVFIDVDEFLFPTQKPDLGKVFEALSDHPQISVPWTMFGRNELDRVPPSGIVQNFHQRIRLPLSYPRALNFKVIVDPSRVTAVRIHGFDVDGVGQSVNDVGKLASHDQRKSAEFFSREQLQLNHYYTRSNEDLEQKLRRGSNKTVQADKHWQTVMKIVKTIEGDSCEDLAADDFLRRAADL